MSRTIEVAGSGKLRVPPRNFRERAQKGQEERSQTALPFDDWANYFTYNGLAYPFGLKQTLGGKEEEIPADFAGLVQGAYRENGVVFACMLVRQLLFSEARFQFQRIRNGVPGDLFGTPALAPLENPWEGGTTADLLTRMIQDADLAGTAFVTRRNADLVRLRPDWVTIVLGSEGAPEVEAGDIDAEIIGYIYHPGGIGGGREPEVLLREQVAIFAPVPDPLASYRGMSWLTPIVRELMGDKAMIAHKLKFMEQGATPNLVVSLDKDVKREDFEKWVEALSHKSEGLANAYRTLYLGGGAQASVVGANLRQLDFKTVQGHGETRIAAAAGVPPVIVGLSEGLASATYSNYGMARRRLSDGTMRPLWRNVAGSLGKIIDVPSDARLWYDVTDVAFLQEDRKDEAEIQGLESRTIRTLLDAGYLPDSVVDAVRSGDWSRLAHSGLFSVQLQKPGTTNSQPNGAAPSEEEAARAIAELAERS